MRKTLAMIFLASVIAVVFIWGARRQAGVVNTDIYATDQSGYIAYAENIARTNFQYVGDRNRMPLYPALMSFFYWEGISDQAFFELGKNVGIAIGLAVSVMIFYVFSRVSAAIEALTGVLIAMFTVLAYKSPYFQAEVLFYGLTLVLFYLLLSLLRKPRHRTAALAGIVGAIAHLTKASVLPAVLLASLLLIVRGAIIWWGRPAADTTPAGFSRRRDALNHLGYACVLFGFFLLVLFPYLQTSKERFGHYFYNVNATFYMWYDSWEEAREGTRAHGDRVGWPDMPADQIPSLQKYVREHTPREIALRLVRGFSSTWRSIMQSYGFAEFVMVYIIALALLFAQNWRAFLRLLHRTDPTVLLFVPGYFLGYALLYAWYTPIAGGTRFVLALFLPALLLLLSLLSFAREQNLSFKIFGRSVAASAVTPLVLLLLIAYVLTFYPFGVTTLYGGG